MYLISYHVISADQDYFLHDSVSDFYSLRDAVDNAFFYARDWATDDFDFFTIRITKEN